MSALKTYGRLFNDEDGKYYPWDFRLTNGCGNPNCDVLAPGEWVEHRSWGGFGMIIAIDDQQITILWSEEPHTPTFPSIAGLTHRVNMQQVAQALIAVQPMSLPAGAIFYMDYTYGGYKLDPRCNEGPLWRRMFWRACLYTSTRIQSWWSSFSSWSRSLLSKPTIPIEPDQFEKELKNIITRCGRRTTASKPKALPTKTPEGG